MCCFFSLKQVIRREKKKKQQPAKLRNMQKLYEMWEKEMHANKCKIIAITSENTLCSAHMARSCVNSLEIFSLKKISSSDCGLFNPSDGCWHLILTLVVFFFRRLYSHSVYYNSECVFLLRFFFSYCARARNIYYGRANVCSGKHCI